MSQEELEDALVEQRVSRKRLGAILVHNRIVTPQNLTAALQAQIHEVSGEDEKDRRECDDPGEDAAPKRRLFRRQRRDAQQGVSAVPSTAKLRELVEITEAQNDELRTWLARQGAELDLAHAELAQRESRITELESGLMSMAEDQSRLAHALRAEIRELENDLQSLRTGTRAWVP